mgnify:CR=1 FL=1
MINRVRVSPMCIAYIVVGKYFAIASVARPRIEMSTEQSDAPASSGWLNPVVVATVLAAIIGPIVSFAIFAFKSDVPSAPSSDLNPASPSQPTTAPRPSVAELRLKGDASSLTNIALGLYWESAYKECLPYLRAGAELGDQRAQNTLGVCYGNGFGVSKNESSAVKWFYQAAYQGDTKAQFNLAIHLLDGKGCDKDVKAGIQWLEKAAMNGYVNAQYNLGQYYAKGGIVDRDVTEAIKWYKMAAQQGDAESLEKVKSLESR